MGGAAVTPLPADESLTRAPLYPRTGRGDQMSKNNPQCTCRGKTVGACHVTPRDLTTAQTLRLIDETGAGVYQGGFEEAIPSDRQQGRWDRKRLP